MDIVQRSLLNLLTFKLRVGLYETKQIQFTAYFLQRFSARISNIGTFLIYTSCFPSLEETKVCQRIFIKSGLRRSPKGRKKRVVSLASSTSNSVKLLFGQSLPHLVISSKFFNILLFSIISSYCYPKSFE